MALQEPVANFDIESVFKSFGYTPTQAEIDALAPAFEGRTNVAQTGMSAVSNYVIAHQAEQGAQSLVQGQLSGDEAQQAQYQKLGQQYGEEGIGNLNAAANLAGQAPQLFGNLTPDQVSQYLAPLQSQFTTQLGQVQSAEAQRGLGGSSIEAGAMSQAQAQYQQQVLQQALQLGLQQQQSKVGALQTAGQGQLGLSSQLTGAGSQYGSLINQLLGQNTGIVGNLAQLPGASTNQAIGQEAAIQALNPQTPSPWGGLIGTGAGALLGSFGGPVGAGLGASIGGSIGSGITGNPTGANVGNQLGTVGLLASLFGKGGSLSGGNNSWSNLFGGGGGGSGGNTGLTTSTGGSGGSWNVG